MAKKKATTGGNDRTQAKEKKGFMSLRNNVFATKLLLWQEVGNLEYLIIDIIIEKTIGWCQKMAKIDIEELVRISGQERTNIYAALRKLKKKEIILWEKVKFGSLYGLNEEYFGTLLTKRQEARAQECRKTFRVVVDNSKGSDEFHHRQCSNPSQDVMRSITGSDNNYHKKSTNNLEPLGNLVPKDILKETIKDILKESEPGESKTLTRASGDMTAEQLEARKKFLWEQNKILEQEERKAK